VGGGGGGGGEWRNSHRAHVVESWRELRLIRQVLFEKIERNPNKSLVNEKRSMKLFG
jgi:hypothetical protein